MAILAAGIIGGASLLGTGIMAYMSSSAASDQQKENRRTEALRIKFSGEESAREESRFQRTLKFDKESFGETKRQNKFANIQSILDGFNNMQRNNFEQSITLSKTLSTLRR